MLKSNILRIRAVSGSSLVEAERKREHQKVSLSCLTNSSTHSSTSAQSLQPGPAPCAVWADFLPTG